MRAKGWAGRLVLIRGREFADDDVRESTRRAEWRRCGATLSQPSARRRLINDAMSARRVLVCGRDHVGSRSVQRAMRLGSV